ncbi:DUF2515 family protein [Falsibacillus albus]|uniref:DUF2515 domain-containing protein n=1 Tax=Falsibacillus albus TaxID=2478915 RepID=A0A3L7JWA2_9BACI|nr:DUF2515 family protein [Falsibacillus albus]RLQ95137.1 DUF2515 domain-containing protein [Falsibacillus albus]
MKKIFYFHRLFPKISTNISDSELIDLIRQITFTSNKDNISRTDAYQRFYMKHTEIRWAFLASMVSRNAGWNMCDLVHPLFQASVDPRTRERLFLTYERANWLIFHDAFPQLLLYHYSTILKRPLFHLLKGFCVSEFMHGEWQRFWAENDHSRLTISLIINEQNLIQEPIIMHPLYKKRVFKTILFHLQDFFHFSCVIFPTLQGNLFGASVSKFTDLNARIDLGKRLQKILFHPDLYPYFLTFAKNVTHTGSRYDYKKLNPFRHEREMTLLRAAYPIVEHHITEQQDWSALGKIHSRWFADVDFQESIMLTEWFDGKRLKQDRLLKVKSLLNEIMGKTDM